jgi:hypothetical protein
MTEEWYETSGLRQVAQRAEEERVKEPVVKYEDSIVKNSGDEPVGFQRGVG